MATPIDLSKPGRRYVHAECATHRVYAHPWGCFEIERVADGATAFFQGDDAAHLDTEIDDAPEHMLRAVLDQYDDTLA